MDHKAFKAVGVSGLFASISGVIVSLIVSVLVYFEWMSPATSMRVLYGLFVLVLFITAFVCARLMEKRGFLVGLGVATVIVLLGLLYRVLGIEAPLSVSFLIRSAVTLLVASVAAIAGVNTKKGG